MRTDIYETEKMPSGMKEYLAEYGWHFSKRMAKFACDKFFAGSILFGADAWDRMIQGKEIAKNAQGYDAQYIWQKCKHLFNLSEGVILSMVDSYFKNNYPEAAFTNFYSDCIANSIIINWEDMI